MTSPNDVPMPNNRPANDDQPTTPIAPVPPATMQIPHNTESTNFIERRYTLSVQQLFQAIHDQLTTGATFTLDEEDARTGMVRFHAFDGAQCTVTVTAEGALGSVIRLSATNDDSNKRSKEFFVMLDRRLGVTQTINPAGGDASIYAPIPPKKPTSKLAVWGIIIGALFAFLAFTSDSGPSWFLGFIAALLSGMSLYATRTNGPKQGRILSYVGLGLIVVGLVVGGIKTIVSDMHDKADQMPECTSYTWTDSELAKMLPEPQSKQGEVTLEDLEKGLEPLSDEEVFFIFGKESRGIDEDILIKHPDTTLRIPMRESMRSLNLSNSAAIAAYEYYRQQGFPSMEKQGELHGRKWESL